jgi:hypothetical protein
MTEFQQPATEAAALAHLSEVDTLNLERGEAPLDMLRLVRQFGLEPLFHHVDPETRQRYLAYAPSGIFARVEQTQAESGQASQTFKFGFEHQKKDPAGKVVRRLYLSTDVNLATGELTSYVYDQTRAMQEPNYSGHDAFTTRPDLRNNLSPICRVLDALVSRYA